MALELFKPFIYSKLEQRGIATTIKSAKKMVEKERPEVWHILEEVVREHPVLLNRAPTLHRLGIQAFEPVLHDDKAIHLHPLVCKAFNADFDGDTMTVHVPLSIEAQVESRILMMPGENLLSPADGRPIVTPTNEMVLGLYYLTMERPDVGKPLVVTRQNGRSGGDKPLPYENRQNGVTGGNVHEFDGRGGPCGRPLELGESEKLFANTDEVIAAFHAACISEHTKVKVRIDGKIIKTTVGRVLLKEILPAEILFSFINKAMTGRDIEQLVKYSCEKVGNEKTAKFLDNLMGLGFEYATRSGMSICMDDIIDVTGGNKPIPYNIAFDGRGGPCGLPALISEGAAKVEELQKLYAEGIISKPERKKMAVKVWNKKTDLIRQKVERTYNQEGTSPSPTKYFHGNIIAMMLKAGVKADLNKISQLSGIKGIVEGRNGRAFEHPVLSNYKKGLSSIEYFMTAFSGGKRVSDRLTTRAGYFFRRLIYAVSNVTISEKDCLTHDMIIAEVGNGMIGRLAAEEVVDAVSGEVIVHFNEMLTSDTIQRIKSTGAGRLGIRSPLTCHTWDGICAACYGTDLSTGKLSLVGTAVGIIAAQAIGSATSQYVIDAWKREGSPAAWLKEVEDLFEARKPGEKPEKSDPEDSEAEEEDLIFEMASLFGDEEVEEAAEETGFEEDETIGEALVASSNPETTQETGGDKPLPYDGESEENREDFESDNGREDSCGLPLEQEELEYREGTSPSPTISLHEILERHGMKAAQLYLLSALQRLYDGAEITINEKHLEVIIRKMSGMIEIKDSADTDFSVGEVVKKPVFYEVNAHVTFSGGRAAVGQEIILGLTKASKLTDSWIAAAAFQDTTKALTNAAIAGKIDNLKGLSENVILGRLIPAGTGVRQSM